ncbi:50S ribosomal protein L25/general stress protein Ctc [Candidatus Bandiella numerosa]|uniref:50S ribosomal protein L25/general stress protein Ctc n=1 Tax=Candidatus Bandiella numerosa TaxID=2570586 RepID=UPI001EFFE374|nr:50S ribosomal protein L25/general stress protein Ctc [Candidatus Bandiella numerosa]
MTELALIGEEKKGSGTGSARALRKEGKISAIIYGFDENHMISLIYKDFLKEYQKGNLSSRLLEVKLGKKILKVISREVQTDPVTDNPIHIDFQLIKENIPVKVAVRVKVINKDKSPGIKIGGILNIVRKYISLNCIPQNIPEYLEIDISGFEIGRNVHISDLVLPEGVVPVDKDNFTILTIAGRVEEKEEEQGAGDEVTENKEQKAESK